MTGDAVPGSSDVKEEEEERLKLTWFLHSQSRKFSRKLSLEAGVMALSVDVCWHPQKWSCYPDKLSVVHFGLVLTLRLPGKGAPGTGIVQAEKHREQDKLQKEHGLVRCCSAEHWYRRNRETGEAQEQGSSQHGLQGGREHGSG